MLARLPTHLNICRFYHSWLEPDWGAMDAAPRASVAAATSAFVASASSTPKHQSRPSVSSAAAATMPTPTMTARGGASQSLSATALAKDDPIVHPWSSTSGASPMVMRFAEFSGVPCADHRPVDELNDGWDRAVSTEPNTQRGGGMGELGGRHHQRDNDDHDDDAAVGSRSGTLSPASSSDPFGSTGGGVDAVGAGAGSGAARRASASAAASVKPVVRSSKGSAPAGVAHELHCCCCLGCDAHVCCADGKKLGIDVALTHSTAADIKTAKYASLPSPASSSASKKRSNRTRINSHDDDGGGFDFSQWNHGDEDEDADAEESTQNGGADDDESEEDEDESEEESDDDEEDEGDSNHDDEDEDDDVDAFDASEIAVNVSASGIPIPKSAHANARRNSSAGTATSASASTLPSANGAATAASSSAAAAAARTDDGISGSPLRLGDGFDASSMGSLPSHKLSSSLSPASVAMHFSGSPPTWISTLLCLSFVLLLPFRAKSDMISLFFLFDCAIDC